MESNKSFTYGDCPRCGSALSPFWFMEDEYVYDRFPNILRKTGRKRVAVDYLQCDMCLKKVCVDGDTFSGEWK
jgi:hypothetical protein